VSALGGLCGVLAVAYLARALHGEQQSVLIVASMVPRQSWCSPYRTSAVANPGRCWRPPHRRGHCITCAKLIPDQILAAPSP